MNLKEISLLQTFPQRTDDAEITYTVIDPPIHGQISLTRGGLEPVKLRSNSRFSQVDLLSGHLKYKLSRKVFSPVDDQFTFTVRCCNRSTSAAGGLAAAGSASAAVQETPMQTFSIHHVPGNVLFLCESANRSLCRR